MDKVSYYFTCPRLMSIVPNQSVLNQSVSETDFKSVLNHRQFVFLAIHRHKTIFKFHQICIRSLLCTIRTSVYRRISRESSEGEKKLPELLILTLLEITFLFS